MSESALDLDTIQAAIASATKRRDGAWAAFEQAVRELAWLRQGLFLRLGDLPYHDYQVMNLLPEGAATRRPTLRQAMLLVMRAGPYEPWTGPQILQALAMNGWAPQPHGDALKRISDMAGLMVSEGQLMRLERGIFCLQPDLAEALARALPPITDYRVAAGYGFSVPDHPAASGGLSDED